MGILPANKRLQIISKSRAVVDCLSSEKLSSLKFCKTDKTVQQLNERERAGVFT